MRGRWRGMRRAFALALVVGLLLSGCASLTSATTRTSAATATPSSTPSPTPTAAQAIAGRLAARAQQAIGSASGRVTATYDTQQAKATLTITITGGVPNTGAKVATAYARVKRLCYWALAAVWSGSGAATAPLREVTALVIGPMQDEFAVIINDWYGFAVVEANTAQRIHWATTSPDAAWPMYDQTMLRVSFVVAD